MEERAEKVIKYGNVSRSDKGRAAICAFSFSIRQKYMIGSAVCGQSNAALEW